MKKHQRAKGFTLIELLIVIAIMGMMASVLLVSYPSAMKSVRDGQRKRDLASIRAALEQYWDVYGRYPVEQMCTDSSIGCTGCGCVVDNFPNGSTWDGNSDLWDLVAEEYLPEIPLDPINNATYYYLYESSGVNQGFGPNKCKVSTCEWYLRARLETTGNYYYVYSVRDADDFPSGGP